jgi:hypothetical protein
LASDRAQNVSDTELSIRPPSGSGALVKGLLLSHRGNPVHFKLVLEEQRG